MAKRPLPPTLVAVLAAGFTTVLLTKRAELLRVLAALIAAAQASDAPVLNPVPDPGPPALLGARFDDQIVRTAGGGLPPLPTPVLKFVKAEKLFATATSMAADESTTDATTLNPTVVLTVGPSNADFSAMEFVLFENGKKTPFTLPSGTGPVDQAELSSGQTITVTIDPKQLHSTLSFQGQFVRKVGDTAHSDSLLSSPLVLRVDAPRLLAPTIAFKKGDGTQIDAAIGAASSSAETVQIVVTPNGDTADSEFQLIDENSREVPFRTVADGQVMTRVAVNNTSPTVILTFPPEEVSAKHEYRGKLVSTLAGRVNSPESNRLSLKVDRIGPKLETVVYDDTQPNRPIVVLRFADDDLNVNSITSTNFILQRRDAQTNTVTPVQNFTVVKDPIRPSLLTLDLPVLPAGDYEITTTEGIAVADRLKDLLGNTAGLNVIEPQVLAFVVLPPGQTGMQVEFPQYTPPKVLGDREQPFNPDDFVETRVARLYYFRDAHRVAQIINRNVRSYNRAAVTQAQREAEAARTLANKLVDERRAAERESVRKAEDLRRTEENLQAVQGAIAATNAAQDDLAQIKTQIGELANQIKEVDAKITPTDGTSAPTGQALTDLQEQRAVLVADQDRLKRRQDDLDREIRLAPRSIDTLRTDLGKAQSDIDTMRTSMQESQEKADAAQAKEDRQVEVAFRKEVEAAEADPDTYVPGKIDSVDPVTQVSLSVIGEGLIQLRGPIKGINKIRTMINQMDSPLGQVKVGVYTIQVNGERGDRMEKVARRIESSVDVSRFLTSHSLMLMRRSVQEVASEIAARAYALHDGHTPIDRDRRYLYAFFGRDFVDALFAMDSEFLKTGNHLLSLNSMDNISLNRALFILALARNDVRQMIIDRFLQHISCDLPGAEYEYLIATRVGHPGKHLSKQVYEDACRRYIFRNFRSLFESEVCGANTLNPMQLEFLRLAQIFKSQMVAEVELKQRIVERGLIQDRANDEIEQAEVLAQIQGQIRRKVHEQLSGFVGMDTNFQQGIRTAGLIIGQLLQAESIKESLAKQSAERINGILEFQALPGNENSEIEETLNSLHYDERITRQASDAQEMVELLRRYQDLLKPEEVAALDNAAKFVEGARNSLASNDANKLRSAYGEIDKSLGEIDKVVKPLLNRLLELKKALEDFRVGLNAAAEHLGQTVGEALKGEPRPTSSPTNQAALLEEYGQLVAKIRSTLGERSEANQIVTAVSSSYDAIQQSLDAVENLRRSMQLKFATRQQLDQRKLLDHLIDEREEKYIELVEGTRSYTATIDAYLKRLVVALEDDCRIQFYDPAFEQIRGAARSYDVELGQVEKTTILTNNRQFAKVEPTATMEFDLPKRDIVITEAMKGAKALVQDYGALLQDPTFLSATSLLSGSPPTAGFTSPVPAVPGLPNMGFKIPMVKNVLPPLPSELAQEPMNLSGKPQPEIGSNLSALIPDPAIYKFETGTGFEIRPVIQPDGDSIIYDFNYMYTTNVREPVRPDEKHLGRVKRHLVHTQVQTSTYELRELSRYTVALKAARTARGVPLFEDIPGLGILFRPLPSAESSLQQNIILGQSTVYPTLFDLMGLRWAPYVVDLDDVNLQEQEFVVRGRRKTIEDWTFDEASGRVDTFLRVPETPQLYRPDLYRTPDRPSTRHPNGYDAVGKIQRPGHGTIQFKDETGRNFVEPDPRPDGYRKPVFDEFEGRLSRDPNDPRNQDLDRSPWLDGGLPGEEFLPEAGSTVVLPPEVIVTPRGPSSSGISPRLENPFQVPIGPADPAPSRDRLAPTDVKPLDDRRAPPLQRPVGIPDIRNALRPDKPVTNPGQIRPTQRGAAMPRTGSRPAGVSSSGNLPLLPSGPTRPDDRADADSTTNRPALDPGVRPVSINPRDSDRTSPRVNVPASDQRKPSIFNRFRPKNRD